MTTTYLKIAGLALLVLALIVLGPLAVIWALNTLFSLGIAYTFWNWLAVVVLQSFVFSFRFNSK